MGVNARRTLEEKFTIGVAAKAYGEVLREAGVTRAGVPEPGSRLGEA
jgi:hypothetical protein